MAEGTFNPDASMHYQMDAVISMQTSLMNEEMVNSVSLLKVTGMMQGAGVNELWEMEAIYASGTGYPSSLYINYANNIVPVYTTYYANTVVGYTIEHNEYTFKAPGWGSTGDNEETSAAASVEQEYSQMITTSEKSISSAFQQMISQDNQSVEGLSSFAQNGFLAQKSYSANLMASNLG